MNKFKGQNSYEKWALSGQNSGEKTRNQIKQSKIDKARVVNYKLAHPRVYQFDTAKELFAWLASED